MDAAKRAREVAKDIQWAQAKLNHLTTLLEDVSKEMAKCQDIIDKANKKLKEIHNES
jgi:F0F1-type ATP synthase membrane subunit b/b'